MLNPRPWKCNCAFCAAERRKRDYVVRDDMGDGAGAITWAAILMIVVGMVGVIWLGD